MCFPENKIIAISLIIQETFQLFFNLNKHLLMHLGMTFKQFFLYWVISSYILK